MPPLCWNIDLLALCCSHLRYSLTARGNSPVSFDQTQDLTYVHKGYSVFIQTDKSVYRPGNAVKFRAVVVTPQQLKPSVVGSIDVEVSDAAGNLIQRYTNLPQVIPFIQLNIGILYNYFRLLNRRPGSLIN